jgi:hypothetical protein
LKGGSLVSIQKRVEISDEMQSDCSFAENIRPGIDLIGQVIDRPLAKNSIYSSKIADYQLMDIQDFLGSEDYEATIA